MPWEVVDTGDRWVAADGGVASVMVVGVDPSCKGSPSFRF